MPWVDVDEEPGRKGPKANGHADHPGRTARRNKNLAASSSTSDGPANKNYSIQEQRNQLPIAKGAWLCDRIPSQPAYICHQGRKLLFARSENTMLPFSLVRLALAKRLVRRVWCTPSSVALFITFSEVPQYILESGIARNGMIAVTQPRKVAATALATRVAVEQNTSVGGLVGYSVRFDERSGPQTRIKYLTDGMIVRELLSDPLLSRYSVVIVDEAHERTLRTDLLITNLKSIQKVRNSASDSKGKAPASRLNPLKIVIMSATLDAEKFGRFFHKYAF